MEFKVENLCGFLIRSKLMTPDEMLAMRQRWQADAKDNWSQPAPFLKWLVAKNYLTEYQAGMLSRGHVDDFYLGEYKILERVGRGRMAGVYKAVHPSGQIVAIKVLPPSRAKNAQTLARFQREARLSVKLKHANVVRSYQVGETKNVHYLVMEYLEGDTLEDVLSRRKRLPPAEAVRLIHQALLGLQHIHELGMVHRDLKPANLMLLPAPARGEGETTLKSNIKVLDIGLAREFFDESVSASDTERMELTAEGVLLGTPDYLAPEQARDPRSIDIRADIYSLGCTLYHVLTGRPPFPDKNILNQMIRHATETAKPLHEVDPTIPEGLTQIVNWMIAKQPGQRYPTPARAAQALDAFLMVTSELEKPAEETPQLQKYLTWLEMSDQPERVAEPPAPPARSGPNPNIPTGLPAKPASNPNIPIGLPAKPASSSNIPAATAKPAELKKKRRTGVKLPGADAPATPTQTAMPALGDQIDVELVAVPDRPPAPRTMMRDVLMVGVGALLMFLLASCVGLIWFVVQWVLGNE